LFRLDISSRLCTASTAWTIIYLETQQLAARPCAATVSRRLYFVDILQAPPALQQLIHLSFRQRSIVARRHRMVQTIAEHERPV
jgi:hypothetical protein